MILDLAARAVLMPLLLAQALYLRRTVLQLPEPTGPRVGSVGQGPRLRLLILGDSSAVGLGCDRQDQALLGQVSARLGAVASVDYALVGEVGARTGDVLQMLPDLDGPYDVVVVALGVNDVTKAVSLRRWIAQQTALLDHLTGVFGARFVVLSGVPPMHEFPLLPQPMRWVLGRQAKRFDRALRVVMARRDDCAVVRIDLHLDKTNMSPDGFHPGPVVYGVWAGVIADAILARRGLLDALTRSA